LAAIVFNEGRQFQAKNLSFERVLYLRPKVSNVSESMQKNVAQRIKTLQI